MTPTTVISIGTVAFIAAAGGAISLGLRGSHRRYLDDMARSARFAAIHGTGITEIYLTHPLGQQEQDMPSRPIRVIGRPHTASRAAGRGITRHAAAAES